LLHLFLVLGLELLHFALSIGLTQLRTILITLLGRHQFITVNVLIVDLRRILHVDAVAILLSVSGSIMILRTIPVHVTVTVHATIPIHVTIAIHVTVTVYLLAAIRVATAAALAFTGKSCRGRQCERESHHNADRCSVSHDVFLLFSVRIRVAEHCFRRISAGA
jgi:hypothetical protein